MAQREESIIRTLIQPTIELDALEIVDLDEGTQPGITKKGVKQSKILGHHYPLISINKNVFNVRDIVSLKIDTTNFLPTITVKVTFTSSSHFLTDSVPKDGDRMNVFIRSRNDAFKPIRNDYLITSVSSTGGNEEGQGMSLTLQGELYVPGIYDDLITAYDGTSYEVLQTIAKTLKLGFASNDTSTDDAQIWINPNDTLYNLIHKITAAAWKDENSFFTSFIDIYYNINFINVNNQFSDDDSMDDGIVDVLMSDDGLEGTELSQSNHKKMFTNIDDYKGTNMWIANYKIINGSSQISNTFGYKIHSIFYDETTQEKYDIFVDPLQHAGAANDNILLKGKAGEDGYKTQVKRQWMGTQYSDPDNGNVHDKYIFAQSHNLLNLKEIDKLNLSITVPRANFNVVRGERVPVSFFNKSDPIKAWNSAKGGEERDSFSNTGLLSFDKFYSGYYMIKGMTFEYKQVHANGDVQVFEEKILLTRRAWPVP